MEHKNSGLFTLDLRDVARGIATAVFTGAALSVIGIVNSVGFDVFSADWRLIGVLMTNGGFAGFVGYLVKNFFSTPDGKLGGKI